jgi:hypothetical protein
MYWASQSPSSPPASDTPLWLDPGLSAKPFGGFWAFRNDDLLTRAEVVPMQQAY